MITILIEERGPIFVPPTQIRNVKNHAEYRRFRNESRPFRDDSRRFREYRPLLRKIRLITGIYWKT